MTGLTVKDTGHRIWAVFSRYKRLLISTVEVLLVICLMSLLAEIFWSIYQVSQDSSENRGVNVRPVQLASAPEVDRLSALDGFELFGKASEPVQKKVAQPKKITAIPRSRLPAKVTGLLSHNNPEQALVIIEYKGRQQSYRIGDTIKKSRITIVAIHPDRVIVKDQGKEQALMLYPDQKISTVINVRQQPVSNSAPVTVNNRAAVNNRVAIDRAIIDKAAILADPKKLTELVSISPVRLEGKMRGYRINPRKQPQIFLQAGLQPNDLVVAINGTDLTDPAAAMAFLKNLDAFERIDLTVEREGMLHQVELSL